MSPLLVMLLAVTLSWDAPTSNCDAASTPLTDLDHYAVTVFQARIVRWDVCLFEDGTTYPCPVYDKTETRFCIAAAAGSPCDGEPFPCLSLAPFEPGPGEVLGWLPPEAVDQAGNSSASCEDAPPADTSCVTPAWLS